MRLRAALLIAFAAMLLGLDRPPNLLDVKDLRHWSYPDYTRVVLELSGEVALRNTPQLLPAAGDRPQRLYIDLDGVWVGTNYASGVPVGDGLLRGVRIGQNTERAVRVVLDLQNYSRHRVLMLTHPDRLVIDVYGSRMEAGAPEHLAGPVNEPRLPADLRIPQTIVLDPGHGGNDPGAIGVGGLREKDVTLRLALALKPRLEARGFQVVMTRNGDRTLSLEERTAIAEGSRGDVFVSLHANAAPRRSLNGIETYYPDANHERHTLRVAALENGVARSQLNELQRTLAKLRVGEVSPQSRRLAEHLQQELVTGLPREYLPVNDLGVKKGPFYVLFLPSMPSVLVESGFVTHAEEARRLRDDRYVAALAEQIAQGLSDYRGASAITARTP
ncbi:MAG: N-acetylmuramoyl-L-alanine amidase [Deltaproteobacteria bacterium]|nr:MAG: N-acetylmuramoyl-L-alanine amidase [Deltaproteobacteria bacterium]